MACATGFLPSARYRTTAASAGILCAAAAAASPATGTTAPAGSTGPAAKPVLGRWGGGRRSCASAHYDGRHGRASLVHHHSRMQEQQRLGGRAAGGVG